MKAELNGCPTSWVILVAGKTKKARNRIYWRNQGGEQRAFGDRRDFADVGGKREALVIVGAKTATTDSVIAESLAAEQFARLQLRRRNKIILGIARRANLAEFASHHLVEKQRSGGVTTSWLESVQVHLEMAICYFCHNRQPLPRDRETNTPLLDTMACCRFRGHTLSSTFFTCLLLKSPLGSNSPELSASG